ncbi:MAG: polyprenyl synthetase family protein [Desulfovibrio sp.]|nr:polyprenyl synthetase family protein [Desulfovibrio sp.]
MASAKLKTRLELELAPITRGIESAFALLPAACRPCATHVMAAGGKRLRPFLVVMFARLMGNGDAAVYPLAASMELLHAATLLHDDILDNAQARRGQPAAHTLFGIPATILAGDALLACGNAVVASYRKPALCQAYSEATMRTAAGEIAEMAAVGRPDLALADYLAIAQGKTGCLIAQSCAMGAIFAGAPDAEAELAATFGANLGAAFQIVDDALDFAPFAQTGKPSGSDLREGKPTPPIMFYRRDLPDKAAFDSRFGRFSQAEADAVSAAIAPYAAESLALADQFLDQARAALTAFPDCEEKQILAEMTDYIRNRRS